MPLHRQHIPQFLPQPQAAGQQQVCCLVARVPPNLHVHNQHHAMITPLFTSTREVLACVAGSMKPVLSACSGALRMQALVLHSACAARACNTTTTYRESPARPCALRPLAMLRAPGLCSRARGRARPSAPLRCSSAAA